MPSESRPSPHQVAERALVLCCMGYRSMAEQEAGYASAEPFRERVVAWVKDLGLDGAFEPHELELLTTPVGELKDPDAILAAHRAAEGIWLFAWALCRADAPPYDGSQMAHHLAEPLGFLEPREHTVLAEPVLRPDAELVDVRELLRAVHWRLERFLQNGEAIDFAEAAADVKPRPVLTAGLAFADNDLALGGRPIADAPPEAVDFLYRVTLERRRAIEWICGQTATYWDIVLSV